MSLIDDLKSANRCSVPIIQIATSDQRATMKTVVDTIGTERPVFSFDVASALKPVNEKGQSLIGEILGDSGVNTPTECLEKLKESAPDDTIIFILGADRLIGKEDNQQAIANCRDPFKNNGRMLILLSPTTLTLPADLQDDVLALDDLPPDDEARGTIIEALHKDSNLPAPTAAVKKAAIASTRGLSSYATDQATALCLSKKGLDTKALRKLWMKNINATPGLKMDQSGTTLDDIGGLENFKDFAKRVMSGRDAPSAVILLEEIEKMFAGNGFGSVGGGDSSGVTSNLLGQLLTFMQVNNATGLIALGPAGSGKSLSSLAMGSIGDIPSIYMDLGSIKGGIVGSSEANMRKCLQVIKSLAGENTFWIGTCNGVQTLPPELRRRFLFGTWFWDLPTAAERDIIWKLYLKKFPGVQDVRPDDEGWTGAEIRTAVMTAYRLRCTPKESAQWIVPVCKMSAEVITALRQQASNRYISANKPGVYQAIVNQPANSTGRKMNLE